MRPRVLALVTLPLLLASTSARAEGSQPTTSATRAAEREKPALPPCAPPEADGELRLSTGCSGIFGLRGSVVELRNVRGGEGAGLMFASDGEEYVRRGIWSARGAHRLAIGGGAAGFEGALRGAAAGGFRIPLGARHGPVFRAGVEGYLMGNDAYYSSLLELPQVQVGWQYMRGVTVLELGGTSGVVLTGRQRGGESEARRIGRGLEYGPYAAVQIPWFRLGGRLTRLPTDDALASPVDVAEGTLCAIAAPFGMCFDARLTRADALPLAGGAPVEVRTAYLGITLGFTRER